MIGGELRAVRELVSNISAAVNLQRAAVLEINRYGISRDICTCDLVKCHIREDKGVAVVRALNSIVAARVEEKIMSIADDE